MKIILFANTDWYLYNFRLPLVRAIRATGHELILLSPPGKYVGKIRGEGFDWRPLPLSRRGINPFEEWKSIRRISKLYRAEKPDLVHHFTIKSVLYGSLAAKRARVPRVVNAVTGMGYLFSTHNLFTAFARPIVKLLYRWLLRGTTVIFQNQRDLDVFLKQRMAEKDASVLIPGSGVDIDHFSPGPTPEGPPIVLLPARMLYDKGVAEFVEAARKLKMEKINARFVLAGASDPGNPSSIPEDQLNQWEQEGILEWWGWQDDMAAVYRSAAIVCLPSYREGLAKSLIEAGSLPPSEHFLKARRK